VTVRRMEMPQASERWINEVSSDPVPRGSKTVTDSVAFLIPLALLALLVPIRQAWPAQVLLVLLLLTVPGVILLRALRVPGTVVASFPVYVPCASIVVLLATGLAVDLVGIAVRVADPLRPWPMLAGLELVSLSLLTISATAPPSVAIPWRKVPRPGPTILPLLLPLMAAAGALRLNNNHGNIVALTALCICILVTVTVLIYSPKLGVSFTAVTLYSVGLAMLWSFSLRGSSVYGFDISNEYYIFQHTVASGIWHPTQSQNAYAAMLSTTVLPTELHSIAGVSNLLVFKLIYPVIGALFPIGVFYLARRIISIRWAFAAGALIIAQPAFGQELPGLARQEVALVLFTSLVAAALETKLSRHLKWPLVLAFALSVVVSHYTTTYVTISLLGLAIFFQWINSWFRPVPRLSGSMIMAFIAAAIGAMIWYGLVTHSSSNIAQLAQATRSQGLDLLPNRGDAEGLVAAYLKGNIVTPIPAGKYAQLVHAEYIRNRPFVHPLAGATNNVYQLRDSITPTPPIKWTAGYNALSFGQVVAQQLIYLIGAVGALILVFRRKVPTIARLAGLLTLATLVFLAGIRFSGTLATFYNAQRALLQAMVFLDIPLFWCMQAWTNGRNWRQTWAVTAGAALLALVFAGGNGVVGAMLGGGTASNLANSGADYEQFYVTAPELASAAWLGLQVKPGQLVYADEYGQLPLVTMTGINEGLLLDVTPETLNNHAWVYASQTNVFNGQGRASFQDHSVSYVFPSIFLNANYNLVYTSGSSKVYLR
jgi:uncharacterized membrane protein